MKKGTLFQDSVCPDFGDFLSVITDSLSIKKYRGFIPLLV